MMDRTEKIAMHLAAIAALRTLGKEGCGSACHVTNASRSQLQPGRLRGKAVQGRPRWDSIAAFTAFTAFRAQAFAVCRR